MYSSSSNRGAIIVFTAILLVVLLGVAALALDLGRLFVLKTEMQNAADAAALSAARELDGRSGAIARAELAAKGMLSHYSKVAVDRDASLLTDADIEFHFFCAIGASEESENPENYCAKEVDGEGKYPTVEDSEAHYVRVTLSPDNNPGRYEIELYFLPLLSLIPGVDPPMTAETSAVALAGYHTFNCKYPPMMMCNPFEPGKTFLEGVSEDLIKPGDAVQLAYQSNSWSPGNFTFLVPCSRNETTGECVPEHGAKALGDYIADPALQGCSPREVTTKTGVVERWTGWGANTRFDIYGDSYSPDEGSPDVNIIEYPGDKAPRGADPRFGNGDWWTTRFIMVGDDPVDPNDVSTWNTYQEAYYPGGSPAACAYPNSRYTCYQYERENGIPCDSRGINRIAGDGDDLVNCPSPRVTEADVGTVQSAWEQRWPGQDFSDVLKSEHIKYEKDRYIPDGVPRRDSVIADGGADGKTTNSAADRRILYVAVLECLAANVHGNSTVKGDDLTFAKFFMLQRNRDPNESKNEFLAEFIGIADEVGEANFHVEVQLYE